MLTASAWSGEDCESGEPGSLGTVQLPPRSWEMETLKPTRVRQPSLHQQLSLGSSNLSASVGLIEAMAQRSDLLPGSLYSVLLSQLHRHA